MIKQIICMLVFVLGLSGCAKLAHLQELLTLKDLSDEGDAQQKIVERQDKDFTRLLEAAKSKALDKYTDSLHVLNDFGAPAINRKIQKDQKEFTQWIYRYMKNFFKSEKVYFYFDETGKLLEWNYVDPVAQQEDKK